MAAIRHVAVLTLHAGGGEAARLPLVVGVLEQLARQRIPVGRELVAVATELRSEIGGRARHPAVGERLARRGAGKRAVTTRRAKALVTANMTARTWDAAAAQRRIEVGVLGERVPSKRRLLGERRMTVLARERAARIGGE